MCNNIYIGKEMTFYQLLSEKKVVIPMVQRDYTYGSKTKRTDRILAAMLDSFYHAFDSRQQLSLGSAFGYMDNNRGCFMPLDGQQRLTTLFLLHYYAALYDDQADWTMLENFTYETRQSTNLYCRLLIENRSEIKQSVENAKQPMTLQETISNMSWYIPDFENDPSIQSMQVVLSKIEDKFKGLRKNLWKLLVDGKYIQFFVLDFGPFDMGDSLYTRMNSRGKFLTSYEIFKSLLLRNIEVNLNDKLLKDVVAKKFDNEWTDLVWDVVGRPTEEDKLGSVDDALVNLLFLLSRLFGNQDKDNVVEQFDSRERVEKMEMLLDTFVWANQHYNSWSNAVKTLMDDIRIFAGKSQDPFTKCLESGSMSNGEALLLMGQYNAFHLLKENSIDEETARLGLRHLRNLIENSDNEIRNENMPSLTVEVKHVITGQLNLVNTFNSIQVNEEKCKQAHPDQWKRLWTYENHTLLRGALWLFAKENEDAFKNVDEMIDCLEKFSYVFQDVENEDVDKNVRLALLTKRDYTQSPRHSDKYHFMGCLPSSWRSMFTKSSARTNQQSVIELLKGIAIEERPFADVAKGWLDQYDQPTDWRYYVVKYHEYLKDRFYHNERYGYVYIDDVYKDGRDNSPFTYVLRSTQFGMSNIQWKLLNMILFERNRDKYNMSMDNRGNSPINLHVDASTVISLDSASLDRSHGGWCIKGASASELQAVGVPIVVNTLNVNTSFDKTTIEIIEAGPSDSNVDLVLWAENNVLNLIAQKYPAFSSHFSLE